MALGMIFVTNSAAAALISGDINFSGITNTFANDTEITTINFWGDMVVTGNTGDFSDINESTASFTNLTTITPTNNLWSFGGFSFDLLNITNNLITENGGALLTGTGIVKADGFEDTVYSWTYSINNMYDSTAFGQHFSASAVPAPAGVALLGFALFGFGATRRNKKN